MTKVMKYYVRLFMFLMPILMLPMVVDPFGFGKNWLIMATMILGMLLWVVQMLVEKKTEVKTNKLLALLGILTVWAWIGWWFRLTVGERMRSFTDIGGVGTLTAVLGWFFIWLQVTTDKEKEKQLNWLTASGILVMLVSMVVFLLPSSKLPIVIPKNNPMVSIGADWSLAGSLLAEGILMLLLVLEWGKKLLTKLSTKQNESYMVEAGVTGILTLALLLDIFRMYKSGWIALDGISAWVIAVEAFKRSPIWGMGAGNFSNAFTAFRPESYNLTKYWASGFKFSSMGILQLWTELGIVGLGIVSLMVGTMARLKKDFNFIKVGVLGLIVAFLPFNVTSILLFAWLVGSVMENGKKDLALNVGENKFNIAPWITGGLVVMVCVFGGYWMVRTLIGDMYMRQSLVAASKNDGGGTYNLQIKAIGLNSYSAEYRKVYSQTNLALASTILSNKEMTPEDKEKASVLVQQAVREAKAAISLQTTNPVYWLNLATLYRQIVGVVDGAADWSFQAYQQAVALEPSNPISKLEMGGLLFAANKFDESDRVFEQVVTVKPDFANGWYNWAYSAKKSNKLAEAVSRLTQAVSLVPADSGDFEKANKELTDWKKELEAETKKTGNVSPIPTPNPETLKTEQPLPTASKEEKVVMPTGNELAPPTPAEVMPTASPTTAPVTVTPTNKP